jgi:phage tail-like protein
MPPAGQASPVITAARFVVNVDGGPGVSFSELNGINSEVEPAEYISVDPQGNISHTKQFGKTKPPTVTLKRGVDNNAQMWVWHQLVLTGDPTARKTATLTLQDAGGQTMQKYVLEGAWLSKLEIGGLKAGDSAVVVETVQIVCDYIEFQPG